MKFWKIVNNLIEETLPDWRDNFLSYKDLKKQLKLIYPKEGETGKPNKRPRLCLSKDGGDDLKEPAGDGGREGPSEEAEVTKEVIDFVKLLEEEIEKFNSFFVDKEEEYIIRLKVLQDRVAEAKNSSEELMRVGREIVDFHGEMVLLENYSALNYTGLVKILKKYDKKSGALIRLPFIQKVLQEPFFKTDVLNKLVKESETMLDPLFSMNEQAASAVAAEGKETCDTETATEDGEKLCKGPEEVAETEKMESMYMKTVSALRVLKEIRSRSSTVSMFSLPPVHSNEMEEVWKNSPVLEQTAK